MFHLSAYISLSETRKYILSETPMLSFMQNSNQSVDLFSPRKTLSVWSLHRREQNAATKSRIPEWCIVQRIIPSSNALQGKCGHRARMYTRKQNCRCESYIYTHQNRIQFTRPNSCVCTYVHSNVYMADESDPIKFVIKSSTESDTHPALAGQV